MPTFAAVQMEPKLFDAEANMVKVINFMHEVSLCKAEIAVFPECALTGYALSDEEATAIAESIPGPRTDRLSEACREADLMAVVVGTIEKDEFGQLYNSAVLVGLDGLIAHYRKTHLPFLGVDRYLAAGDALPGPFETPIGRLGLLICYDLRFPEPSRVLALAGAQVILLPTAWPSAATLYPDFMAQSRASENGVFLVAANRVGEERGTSFLGRSVIVGPDGGMLAEAGSEGEEILCAEIDPERSDLKQLIFVPGEYELYPFDDRRPELYRPIIE
ncbi:MAG: carbon-nitrogen hydrolase family protein [Anaerolineaceae bacterium]|nr:MAG: carbon-nitrogen hydrolase family protein [Anaerolineaceae bacterium]